MELSSSGGCGAEEEWSSSIGGKAERDLVTRVSAIGGALPLVGSGLTWRLLYGWIAMLGSGGAEGNVVEIAVGGQEVAPGKERVLTNERS